MRCPKYAMEKQTLELLVAVVFVACPPPTGAYAFGSSRLAGCRMVTKELLSLLLPRAIHWCSSQSQRVGRDGLPLTDAAIADARSVGVSQPQNVRVLVVDSMPLPDDPALAAAAASVGFLGEGTAGLTLGYSILVRQGRLSRRLLTHELRHVAQFERAGSLQAFLADYLDAVVAVGYEACPFEVDARQHELANVLPRKDAATVTGARAAPTTGFACDCSGPLVTGVKGTGPVRQDADACPCGIT